MAKEIICGKTKVTINKTESYICDKFTDIWDVLEKNDIGVEEETKTTIIRVLFINGYIDLSNYGADAQMEIVWDN